MTLFLNAIKTFRHPEERSTGARLEGRVIAVQPVEKFMHNR
jgi:hypothetical protein